MNHVFMKPFDGTNFGTWSYRMKLHLEKNKVLTALDEADAKTKQDEAWKTIDVAARDHIVKSLEDRIIDVIKDQKTARDIFGALERVYAKKGLAAQDMPRTYKRKVGSRRYKDYDEEKLQKCLSSIRSSQMSHREATKYYNIPRRTILNKPKENHMKKPGKQPIFSNAEETVFVDCIAKMSDYGFPLTEFDLRMIIKDYLQQKGRTLEQMSDGDDANLEMTAVTNPRSILKPTVKKIGQHCVVKYDGDFYPGVILSVDQDTAKVSTMAKGLKSWKWPEKVDILDYKWEDVMGNIEEPGCISKTRKL
ncbi:hypothetical protein GE061_000608 [Apolygus lucorum]|uniref:HTH psq-type domain-containing protein n=1 Tax=Apolygus lucorum TaxID=248454 RepID=A0A8S9Y6X2_APOLU|nr:hypothetical protein GE061_000608 [Apolygus lucorum]